MPEVKLLNNNDVMRMMGIRDNRTIKRYRQKGLGYIRVGKAYMYTQDQVNAFINKNSSTNI
jgi:hypothetical protein